MNTEVEVVMVTPEMAQKWLTSAQYEFQRDIRQGHVRFLADEMLRGAFKQDTALEFSRVNGSEWLTDGRHRLNAVAWSQLPQRFVVIRRTLKDEDAVALDYTRTDKGKRRTIEDDYRTLSLTEELGVTVTQINHLGSACVFMMNDFKNVAQAKIHSDDRLRMMREYNEAYSGYLEVTAGSPKEIRHRLERAATLSIALVTFRFSATAYSAAKIEEFWKGVAFDDGVRMGDPRKTANRHLLETGMSGGSQTTAKPATAAYSARYIANCFNAYIDAKTLNFTKIFDTMKPIVIKGSPFNGK